MLDISKFGKEASYLQVGSECWISPGLVRLPNITYRLGRVLDISWVRFDCQISLGRVKQLDKITGYLHVE